MIESNPMRRSPHAARHESAPETPPPQPRARHLLCRVSCGVSITSASRRARSTGRESAASVRFKRLNIADNVVERAVAPRILSCTFKASQNCRQTEMKPADTVYPPGPAHSLPLPEKLSVLPPSFDQVLFNCRFRYRSLSSFNDLTCSSPVFLTNSRCIPGKLCIARASTSSVRRLDAISTTGNSVNAARFSCSTSRANPP